jgi:hypothetical protein
MDPEATKPSSIPLLFYEREGKEQRERDFIINEDEESE